jgi:KipI family sensor histidine kinase inhibitor
MTFINIKTASVDSVIIYFGDTITKEINHKVKSTYTHLKSLNNSSLIELIPSYTSLLVIYDIFQYDDQSIKEYLRDQLLNLKIDTNSPSKILTIDVYYGLEVGLDLKRVAKLANLSINDVINIHSKKIYDVYAIGFLPAFAYLGKVENSINTPRLQSPRKIVPKGSVAIANEQSAIYPVDSPGGWNILGKTTYNLFDKNLPNLCEIDINTQIKFNPITKSEFLAQGGNL